jgi:hypothetical protein
MAQLVRRHAGNSVIIEEDISLLRIENSGNKIEECRFSRSIGPD